MSGFKRVAIYGLPALLVAVVWWFTSWNAAVNSAEASTSGRDAAVQANAQATSQLSAADAFLSGGAQSQAQLEDLRTALPATTDLGRFVLLNSAAATAAGVTVSDLVPSAPGAVTEAAPKGMTATGIDISVVGSQSAIGAYLAQLAALPRSVAVDELSTNRASDTAVELTIHARIFQLGEPPTSTKLKVGAN